MGPALLAALLTLAGAIAGPAVTAPPAQPVSVLDYGARPGDGKDDTAAFAKAFAAGARDVYVPPGTYVVGELVMPDDACLHGGGIASLLTLRPGATSVLKPGNEALIRDLALDGGGEGKSFNEGLISFTHKRRAVIENVRITNSGRTAIMADHGNDLEVRGCEISHVMRAVSIVFSDDARIVGNTVRDCSEHGIVWWGHWVTPEGEHVKMDQGLVVANNLLYNAGGGPIWGTGMSHITITGNVVQGADDVGIDCEWCDDVAITGNVVQGADDVGIDCEWCDDVAITGNSVRGAVNAGISLFFACRNVAIAGNSVVVPDVDHGERCGIWLTGPNREALPQDHGHRQVAITGNTVVVEGVRARGIAVGRESRDVALTGNVLANATVEDLQDREPAK